MKNYKGRVFKTSNHLMILFQLFGIDKYVHIFSKKCHNRKAIKNRLCGSYLLKRDQFYTSRNIYLDEHFLVIRFLRPK